MKKALFYTVLMIKSDFDTSRLFKMVKYGILKKAILKLHFEGLTDLTSNCRTHPTGKLVWKKPNFILF